YMKQRLHGWVMGGYPIIYPAIPPKESHEWRVKRRSLEYDLPILEGVSEGSKNFFFDSNWKMQQYAIPGACEVKPGDIVIDAGAFIGDTALYFAQIVGTLGKVYAFEPIPETIEILKKNIEINRMGNIIRVVPKAISNKSHILHFTNMGSDSTAIEPAVMINHKDKLQRIEAISLDNFVDINLIERVDFLKADLQGFDVAFIEGGIKTIEKFSPKCALTVYHKELDVVQLPSLLLKAQPKYKLWFRCESEPVLYAAI
ncbi:MAG: FkbM family methyltransferase, partial [Desulfovibrio sp.]|nr:FkbM family methyltransferase [Desulfovibrio sp.]